MPFETGEKASEPFSGPFGEKDWIRPTAQVFGPVYFKAMSAADKYNFYSSFCTASSDQWWTGMGKNVHFTGTESIFQRNKREQERMGQRVNYSTFETSCSCEVSWGTRPVCWSTRHITHSKEKKSGGRTRGNGRSEGKENWIWNIRA